jgi:hypothetical protein
MSTANKTQPPLNPLAPARIHARAVPAAIVKIAVLSRLWILRPLTT